MDLVIIRGGGDLASGVAHRLYRSGFKVVIIDIESPTAIRRTVSFCEAIFNGEITIEGVKGILAKDLEHIEKILKENNIPIYIDGKGDIIEELKPLVVVDAIMAKKNLGTTKDMAPITIALGPGFEAGVDTDLVIETKRGHYLGQVISQGMAITNTGVPNSNMGYEEERVIRALAEGKIKVFYNIGDRVEEGDIICGIGGKEVKAQIGGILRGIIKENLNVYEGQKIGDIDPRGVKDHAFTISEKARAVGGGVLEGILYLKNRRRD